MEDNIKYPLFQINRGNSKNNLGFSLIEALISLSIIVILLGLVFFGYTDYRKKNALQLGAEQVKSALDEAKNKALAPEEDVSGKKPKSYFLFIDFNLKNNINIKREFTDGTDTPETTSNLPSKVEFHEIKPNNPANPVINGGNGEIKFSILKIPSNEKNISFDGYAPSAINSGQPNEGIGTITLQYDNDNLYINITLNCYTGEMNIGQIRTSP